jgi:outer membrane protein assembly factor BamC
MSLSRCIAFLGIATSFLVFGGCGFLSGLDNIVPDNTKEYRRAKTLPPLEIPPNLSADAIRDDLMGDDTGAATYLEYQEQIHNPLMEVYGIEPDIKPRLESEGEQLWLTVPGASNKVWERVRNFWLENNFEVKAEDIRIGFMDAMGASEQDNYRVRIERDKSPNSTIVYVKQHVISPNPRQEEAMLRRLAEYLGTLHAQDMAQSEQKGQQVAGPNQISMIEGGVALQIAQEFSHAWHQVGLVLDRKGFSVEDRNRARGVYYVRYDDPFTGRQERDSGWFSKLAFWEKAANQSEESRYQIKLISEGAVTHVVVLDAHGQRDDSETAKRLLSLLGEQLTE